MWRRPRERDRYPELLIEECESFLAGVFVERCEARGEPVPVWAWMNVLAHGTDAELRAAAENRSGSDEGHQALAFVAGELVDLIDDGVLDLETFQRGVLVPLELDVIACPATSGWSASQLVSALLRALPMRSSHRH
jgi:hypothetical protein